MSLASSPSIQDREDGFGVFEDSMNIQAPLLEPITDDNSWGALRGPAEGPLSGSAYKPTMSSIRTRSAPGGRQSICLGSINRGSRNQGVRTISLACTQQTVQDANPGTTCMQSTKAFFWLILPLILLVSMILLAFEDQFVELIQHKPEEEEVNVCTAESFELSSSDLVFYSNECCFRLTWNDSSRTASMHDEELPCNDDFEALPHVEIVGIGTRAAGVEIAERKGEELAKCFFFYLGVALGMNGVLCVIFHQLGQPSIVASIVVGVLLINFSSSQKADTEYEILDTFGELGKILLLFMAGLEVDFANLRAAARTLTIVAFGQIFTFLMIGTGLGWVIIDREILTAAYFGLCMVFSSTTVVLDYLKRTHQLESPHGQIILGLLVTQDVVALVAIALLSSLKGTGGPSVAESIALLFAELIFFALSMFVFAKTLLFRVFRVLAPTRELLFAGTVGWALFWSGIGTQYDFRGEGGLSVEITAFMAGCSLTVLPFKIEIEDKVSTIKQVWRELGLTLYFITVGIELGRTTVDILMFGQALAASAIVVVATPLVMIVLGYSAKMTFRDTFFIGCIINQVSEFSIILAAECQRYDVFSERASAIVTISCIITFVFSSIGQNKLVLLYELARPYGAPIFERRALGALISSKRSPKHPEQDCVAILGLSRLTGTFCELARSQGRQIVLLEDRHEVVEALAEKGGVKPPMHNLTASALSETHRLHFNVDMVFNWHLNYDLLPIFADLHNPDSWADSGLASASIVFCSQRSSIKLTAEIASWLKRIRSSASVVGTCTNDDDAMFLYEAGCSYVVQVETLASKSLYSILEHAIGSGTAEEIVRLGNEHRALLNESAAREDIDLGDPEYEEKGLIGLARWVYGEQPSQNIAPWRLPSFINGTTNPSHRRRSNELRHMSSDW